MCIGPARRANVLITDLEKVNVCVGRSKSTIDNMMSMIKSTLRNEGSVLLPVEPNCRVLELLLILESAFNSDASLGIYPIVFVSPLGDVVLDQVKTRMEWMNASVLGEFENSMNFTAHPFLFNHIQLMSSLSDFNEAYSYRKPKIVLATSASLEYGDSRELFCRMCNDENNLVLFTETRGLIEGCFADRIMTDALFSEATVEGNRIYKERQFLKTSIPDEQLRDIYRESLQREVQDDEIRRRRAREKMLASLGVSAGQSGISAPSSATAVPVDLIRLSNESYEEIDGSNFFRPQLFVSQTVASSAVVGTKPQVSDYGEGLTQIEIDTWRAHAETSELGAAKEASQEAAAAAAAAAAGRGVNRVKSERSNVKGEMIKGDLDDETGGRIKGELGISMAGMLGSESFDWRRDMTVRFGEPKRVEVRERIIKVVCKIKMIPFDGDAESVHRREFISSVKPKNLILLPSKNVRDIQVLMLAAGSDTRIMLCQEWSTGTGEQTEVLALSVAVDIASDKVWLTVDPSISIKNVELYGSDIKISKLSGAAIVGPLRPGMVPDLVQVPSGEHVEFGIAAGPEDDIVRKRPREVSDFSGGLFVSEKPIRLNQIAQDIRSRIPSGRVQFISKGEGGIKRSLLVSSETGGDELLISSTGGKIMEIVGVPSDNFYKIRKMLYDKATCI
jgi:hypothetical protein